MSNHFKKPYVSEQAIEAFEENARSIEAASGEGRTQYCNEPFMDGPVRKLCARKLGHLGTHSPYADITTPAPASQMEGAPPKGFPQTFGELALIISDPPIEPHVWDNNTSDENIRIVLQGWAEARAQSESVRDREEAFLQSESRWYEADPGNQSMGTPRIWFYRGFKAGRESLHEQQETQANQSAASPSDASQNAQPSISEKSQSSAPEWGESSSPALAESQSETVPGSDYARIAAEEIHKLRCGSNTHDHPQNGCQNEIAYDAEIIRQAARASTSSVEQINQVIMKWFESWRPCNCGLDQGTKTYKTESGHAINCHSYTRDAVIKAVTAALSQPKSTSGEGNK